MPISAIQYGLPLVSAVAGIVTLFHDPALGALSEPLLSNVPGWPLASL